MRVVCARCRRVSEVHDGAVVSRCSDRYCTAVTAVNQKVLRRWKVTAVQYAALAAAYIKGGRLVRLPGGFWTYAGCPLTPRGTPEWSVAVGTIRVLEARGYLMVVEAMGRPTWAADRAVTPDGASVVGGWEELE